MNELKRLPGAGRVPTHEEMPRTWQRMLSGRIVHVLDPSPLDYEIEDIALSLSRESRWNGQTEGEWGYSVNQHELFVLDLLLLDYPAAPAALRRATMIHDGPEVILRDTITPVKAILKPAGYEELERRHQIAMHIRFDIPPVLPEAWQVLIKNADRRAAFNEAVLLAGWPEDLARKEFGRPRDEKLARKRIDPWPPREAYERFLATWNRYAVAPETGALSAMNAKA